MCSSTCMVSHCLLSRGPCEHLKPPLRSIPFDSANETDFFIVAFGNSASSSSSSIFCVNGLGEDLRRLALPPEDALRLALVVSFGVTCREMTIRSMRPPFLALQHAMACPELVICDASSRRMLHGGVWQGLLAQGCAHRFGRACRWSQAVKVVIVIKSRPPLRCK